MNVDIIYPEIKKKVIFLTWLRKILNWVFLAAVIACPIINLAVGGKAWSVVAVWAVFGVWKMFVAPDVIEYSLIRQTSNAVILIAILFALIDQLLAPGWAGFVIPILGVAALVLTAIFFCIDVHTQKQNMMPMIWLILISFGFLLAALFGWSAMNWPIIVLGSVAGVIAIVGLIVFHKEIWLELKKRFHLQ